MPEQVMFGALRCSPALERQPAFSEKEAPGGIFAACATEAECELAKKLFREALWATQKREADAARGASLQIFKPGEFFTFREMCFRCLAQMRQRSVNPLDNNQ